MEERVFSGAETVEAVLEGGPSDLPAAVRSGRVPVGDQKVKVVHRGGYEHFERADGDGAFSGPVVYRWTTRTKMAE